ncbi:hypothetical protein BS17DRAFT_820568 [Gyrodon lividus]|nr:hypothetical protein BS17DRAFT_820568 [Gyrodon lividus]
MQRRKHKEVASLQAGKKKVQMQSPVADNKEDEEDKDKEWAEGKDDRDVLGALTEVLTAVVVEMHNMAPEAWSEEVVEPTAERDGWKAWSGEEEEVEWEV